MSAQPNFEDCSFAHPPAEKGLALTRAALDLPIDPADWDMLFGAVTARLRHAVGEDLRNPPDVPLHSAALTVGLIQAEVLDCVSALDQLHAALKQERSQRPTP